MKQRITYLLRDAHQHGGVDPSTLKVGTDSLSIPGLDAAKEWRITIGVKELPQEVWQVLKNSHEFHLRWASTRNYDAVSPLVSRTPPGLHAFFTPRKDSTHDDLCPLLLKVFGEDLSCLSLKESFTSPPILSERFAMAAAYQYHQNLPSLDGLVKYLQQEACATVDTACKEQMASLLHASTVDFDFDAISHALTVTAMWTQGLDGGVWRETIRLQSKTDSVEVGVLNGEKATEPEEISLGGFLTVLGEDDKPSATLFSFPSRHHSLPKDAATSFTASFRQPTGLHPTLQISFPAGMLSPPASSCALHAYLTLPSTVFLDRYQFSDPLFLASQNLVALHSLSGEADLEAPEWVMKKWGSAALFELKGPRGDDDDDEYDYGYDDDDNNNVKHSRDIEQQAPAGQWDVSIPLHLRYLKPSASKTNTSEPEPEPELDADPGYRTADIPWPAVFWACEAEDGLKMSVNPFDRVNLGYDGLFGPKTMFYHVPPAPVASAAAAAAAATMTTTTKVHGTTGEGVLVERLRAPVMDLARAKYVEVGTAVAVVVGFAWVCWMLLKPASSSSSSSSSVAATAAGKATKKKA